MNKLKFTLVVLLILTGCSESETRNRKQYDKIVTELKDNYNTHKEIFEQIDRYAKFDYISDIEFTSKNKVTLAYQDQNGNKTNETIDKDINSTEIADIVKLENTSVDSLLQLRNSLNIIDVKKIKIMSVFDNNSGRTFKELDLLYTKKMTGLNFHYRVYETSLDSTENLFHQVLIQHDSTGGKLSDRIIWYYN